MTSDDRHNHSGIVIHENDSATYLYICGLKMPRLVHLSENITLSPAECNPKPNDMIDCIMKYGSGLEYDLGILIASLRVTTAELCITGKKGEELAIQAWNSQWLIVYISAILNCYALWTFQFNKKASDFESDTRASILTKSIFSMPKELREVSEEECELLEERMPIVIELGKNTRFNTAIDALWASHLNPRPSIKAMILWGGIESLFLIKYNIKKQLSKKIAEFLEDEELEEKVKSMYEKRSSSVHELKNPEDVFIKESRELLHKLVMKCVEKKKLPELKKNNNEMA